jgi:tRNA nucleotidyltransferase/poly(A) polymerase
LHDPLRILRAARYASRFGLTLTSSTEQNLLFALGLNAGKRITKERLGNELHLLFADSNPVDAWALLSEWGCIAKWIPEVSTIPTLISEFRSVCEYAQKNHDDVPLALWLLLSIKLTAGARERLGRLTATNKDRHRVWTQSAARFISIEQKLSSSYSVDFPERYALWGEALYKTASPLWSNLSQTHGDAVHWWRENGQHVQIAVDGGQLMKNGIPKGPQIGACLRRAWHRAWMGGNKEEQLFAAMSEYNGKE